MKTCYKMLRKSFSHLTPINCTIYFHKMFLPKKSEYFFMKLKQVLPLTILQRYVVIKEAT